MSDEYSYEDWIAELQRLAQEQACEWLVSEEPLAHQEAFLKGLSPAEELDTLKDMGEWRGCGCGG